MDSVALRLLLGRNFVQIPNGEFLMGDNDGSDDEMPAHRVHLSSFWMQNTPVTQGQYLKIMGTNPSHFKGNAQSPVEMISWNDAIRYCNKLSLTYNLEEVYILKGDEWIRQAGKRGFRLPTEAEWEYCVRAGTQIPYFFGAEELATDYAWFEENAESQTRSHSMKKCNPFGLFDMIGNVWEWIEDWHDKDYYAHCPYSNPYNTVNTGFKGMKGGAYRSPIHHLRSAVRFGSPPTQKMDYLGFRCALDLA